MKKNKRSDSYDPKFKLNILPLGEKQKQKDDDMNQVNLQLQRVLFDPTISQEEAISSQRGTFGNQQLNYFHGDTKHLQHEGQSYMTSRDADEEKVKRYVPTPVPLNSEWLKKLPEECPSLHPTCVKQTQRIQDKISCQKNAIDSSPFGGAEYKDTIETMPQSEPLEDSEETKSFIKNLLSDSDKIDHRSYIRSIIPNIDDSIAAQEKKTFVKSLIVNPADLPQSQRSTYASMKSSAVFDGDSSYALHYLDQTSPTSERSIPNTIEDSSENRKAPKYQKPLFTCEKDLYCNTQMYRKYPPLIQQQQYNRFPGPRNPPRCSLQCPYKGNLEVRKEKLKCLLLDEYSECESELCIMGLGFVSTQP